MPDQIHFSLVKPTIETPFHIDFDWWKAHDSDWRVFLVGLLCPTHQSIFSNLDQNVIIDIIDPVSAEVKTVDGLLHTLLNHCAKQENFLNTGSSLVSSVFRIFLANNNSPLSPTMLSELMNKPAKTILITLSSPTVYKGIRPMHEMI